MTKPLIPLGEEAGACIGGVCQPPQEEPGTGGRAGEVPQAPKPLPATAEPKTR